MSGNFLNTSLSKNEIIKECAEFTGRKSYFLIDHTGKIKRKSINMFLPIIAFANDNGREEALKMVSEKYIWKDERRKIKKADRATSVSVDDLKKNLFKTLQKSESVFAIKFANELFLRDREAFNNIVLFFACINRENGVLPLMALSALKLMEEDGIDYYNPLYLIVELLAMYPKNFKAYEMATFGKVCKGKKEPLTTEISLKLQNRAFIKAVKMLEKADIEGVKSLKLIAENMVENNDESQSMTEIDEIVSERFTSM